LYQNIKKSDTSSTNVSCHGPLEMVVGGSSVNRVYSDDHCGPDDLIYPFKSNGSISFNYQQPEERHNMEPGESNQSISWQLNQNQRTTSTIGISSGITCDILEHQVSPGPAFSNSNYNNTITSSLSSSNEAQFRKMANSHNDTYLGRHQFCDSTLTLPSIGRRQCSNSVSAKGASTAAIAEVSTFEQFEPVKRYTPDVDHNNTVYSPTCHVEVSNKRHKANNNSLLSIAALYEGDLKSYKNTLGPPERHRRHRKREREDMPSTSLSAFGLFYREERKKILHSIQCDKNMIFDDDFWSDISGRGEQCTSGSCSPRNSLMPDRNNTLHTEDEDYKNDFAMLLKGLMNIDGSSENVDGYANQEEEEAQTGQNKPKVFLDYNEASSTRQQIKINLKDIESLIVTRWNSLTSIQVDFYKDLATNESNHHQDEIKKLCSPKSLPLTHGNNAQIDLINFSKKDSNASNDNFGQVKKLATSKLTETNICTKPKSKRISAIRDAISEFTEDISIKKATTLPQHMQQPQVQDFSHIHTIATSGNSEERKRDHHSGDTCKFLNGSNLNNYMVQANHQDFQTIHTHHYQSLQPHKTASRDCSSIPSPPNTTPTQMSLKHDSTAPFLSCTNSQPSSQPPPTDIPLDSTHTLTCSEGSSNHKGDDSASKQHRTSLISSANVTLSARNKPITAVAYIGDPDTIRQIPMPNPVRIYVPDNNGGPSNPCDSQKPKQEDLPHEFILSYKTVGPMTRDEANLYMINNYGIGLDAAKPIPPNIG